jgi:hypothetical protein
MDRNKILIDNLNCYYEEVNVPLSIYAAHRQLNVPVFDVICALQSYSKKNPDIYQLITIGYIGKNRRASVAEIVQCFWEFMGDRETLKNYLLSVRTKQKPKQRPKPKKRLFVKPTEINSCLDFLFENIENHRDKI